MADFKQDYESMNKWEKIRADIENKKKENNPLDLITQSGGSVLQTDNTAGGGYNIGFQKESAADRGGTPEVIREAPLIGGDNANLFNLGSSKLQAVYDDSYVNDFFSGANNMISLIPDATIYAASRALGVPEELANKDFFKSILNAGDYETTEQVQGFFGKLLGLKKGTGDYVGQTDTGGKMAAGAGELVALSASLGMTLQAYANKTLGTVLPILNGSTVAGNVRNLITSTLQQSPGTSASIDATLSAISGVGGEAAGEYIGPEYEGLGAVATPFVPLMLYQTIRNLPTPFLLRNRNKIKEGVVSGYKKVVDLKNQAKERNIVGADRSDIQLTQKDLANATKIEKEMINRVNLTEQNKKNFDETQELLKLIEPFSETKPYFTAGESSLDKTLLLTQEKAIKNADPVFLDRNRARIANIAEGIERYKEQNLGVNNAEVDGNALAVFNELDNSIQLQYKVIDNKLVSNIDELVAAESNLDFLSPREILGKTIREKIITAKTLAGETAEKLATKLKINESTVSADANTIQTAKDNITEVIGTTMGPDGKVIINPEALSTVQPLVKKFLDFGGKISFLDWKSFKMNVSDELGRAIANGNSSDIRALSVLQKQLDETITFGTKGVMNENWNTFKVAYEDIMTPYNGSTVKQILRTEISSTPSFVTPGEEVAKAFLRNSKTATEYKELFKNDPIAMGNIKSALLTDMKLGGGLSNSIFKNGVPNPAKIDGWLNKNMATIKALGFEDSFTGNGVMTVEGVEITAPNVIIALANKAAQNTTQSNHFMNQKLVKLLYDKSVDGKLGNIKDPSKVIETLLSSKGDNNAAVLTELAAEVKKLNNPDYTEAFNSVVIEKIFNQFSGVKKGGWETFLAFMIGNRGNGRPGDAYKGFNLDSLLGKDHVDNLITLGKINVRLDLAESMTGGQGLNITSLLEKQYAAMGTSVPSLTTQGVAAAGGRISKRHLFVYLASRAFNEQANIRNAMLLEEAIINPDFAKFLLTNVKDDGLSAAQIKTLNKQLFSHGYPTFSEALLKPFGKGLSGKKFYGGTTNQSKRVFPLVPEAMMPDDVNPDVQINKEGFEAPPIPTSEYKNPFLPSEQYANTMPNAPMPNMASNNTMVSDLFPNDPTSRAIENRRMQGGIGSLA
tara:strand:- start:347 stop:3754 length:3408 start_codon:yes stop_codon:yes gene_type:complete